MRSFLYHIFAVILVAESCLALRCYICDSSNNEKCADLSDKSIQPQDCNEKSLDIGTGSLMTLLKVQYNKIPNVDGKFICQKAIASSGNGTKIVIRRCNVKIENPDPCNYTMLYRLSSLHAIANRDDFKCSVCEEDGCNSAHSYQHTWIPLLMILIASFYTVKQLI